LPGGVDPNSPELMAAVNKTAYELQQLVQGISSVNIFMQAKEVQFHVIIVHVFVHMFCAFILTKC
jgi:hypothetical protein